MDQPVAIITGAGRGIGQASAVELHAAGYRAALVARSEHELHETNGLIGRESLIIVADVSDPASTELIVARTLERFGRIDALVNAAGTAPMHDVESTTPQIWREVLDANLSSAFYLCRAVWPIFRKRGGGVIVNVSSFSARDPFPRLAAYGAAKAGLNLLGLSLAREGAPLGIRVHTVAPAAVETRMLRKIIPHEQYPSHKALRPQDVASVIARCVGGELRYTSGEVIWVSQSPG
jgi:NAD(P)-dependent dehydrogenase (short-subunit alcohol dehydrogenase family)